VEIALLFALILFNGLFAMSEIALATSRKARLQGWIDKGDSGAEAAAKLGEDPTRFLSTVQIGITSIGVLNGIVGEAALAQPFATWLLSLGFPKEYAGYVSTGLVVVVITYVSIVLGELVPKRIGQSNPEAIARIVAKPISWLAVATTPFVRVLSGSTNAVLRLLGVKLQVGNSVTEAEIHAVLAEGTNAGVIESNEHTMVRNVFRLDDRHINSLMVPRGDIVCLEATDSLEQCLAVIERSEHARLPVVRGGLADIVGVAVVRHLLSKLMRGGIGALTDELEPPLFVPETITGMELLDNFRSSGRHMAFVVDEYGEVQGLVTLQDLIEAITGEFNQRDPNAAWARQREDGSWLLDGLIPLPELKDRLGLDDLPEEERGRYHTLSGMIMLLSGKLPVMGDIVHWQGWKFEVLDLDNRKIDKVLASHPLAVAPAHAASGDPPSQQVSAPPIK
jgi:putative hemolysin